MTSHCWSLKDARKSFSAVGAAAVRGAPQTVTKRGKPAVVVLSVAQYQRLSQCEAAETPNFVAHILGTPQDDGAFERGPVKSRNVDF